MPYSGNNPDKMILRDYLALDRTILANERTILAYFRTTIMLFATGLTLLKVFADDRLMFIIGIIMVPASFLVATLGVVRFLKIRKRLKNIYKSGEE